MNTVIKIVKSSIGILLLMFKLPSIIEHCWIAKNRPGYKTVASTTFSLSFIFLFSSAYVICPHLPERIQNSDAVFLSIVVGLDVLALAAMAFWRADTWSKLPNAATWFLCQGLFAFLGGWVFAIIALILIILSLVVFLIQMSLWALHININVGAVIPDPARIRSVFDRSPEESAASGSGADVESQDMFNDELKQKQSLGPDKTLVHDESQDSIYGNTYVDKDSGKEYRVTETDAFGHPVKVEEKWP